MRRLLRWILTVVRERFRVQLSRHLRVRIDALSLRGRTAQALPGSSPGSARHRLEGRVAFRVVTGRRIINTSAM